MQPDRSAHDETAAEEVHRLTLDFLQEHLVRAFQASVATAAG